MNRRHFLSTIAAALVATASVTRLGETGLITNAGNRIFLFVPLHNQFFSVIDWERLELPPGETIELRCDRPGEWTVV